jgi:hypothetical protein
MGARYARVFPVPVAAFTSLKNANIIIFLRKKLFN